MQTEMHKIEGFAHPVSIQVSDEWSLSGGGGALKIMLWTAIDGVSWHGHLWLRADEALLRGSVLHDAALGLLISNLTIMSAEKFAAFTDALIPHLFRTADPEFARAMKLVENWRTLMTKDEFEKQLNAKRAFAWVQIRAQFSTCCTAAWIVSEFKELEAEIQTWIESVADKIV